MTLLTALLQDAPAAPAAGADPFDVPAMLHRLADWAVGFAPSLIGAAITLVVGVWVAKLVTRGLRTLMARGKVDESLAQFLSGLAYYGLLALVFIAAAGKLGVETTSFVALLGAVGLAVGFALQGSLGNLAAGVMILLFRPFRVGDVVEAAGQVGAVREIGVFATTLATVDNRKVIIPNASITGGSIVNATAHETRRIDLLFGIGYGDDLRKARATILRVVGGEPRVLADPAPNVVVAALGDSSVQLKLLAWVKTPDFLSTQAALIEQVKLAFDQDGITIPFPQREIRLLGQPGG